MRAYLNELLARNESSFEFSVVEGRVGIEVNSSMGSVSVSCIVI